MQIQRRSNSDLNTLSFYVGIKGGMMDKKIYLIGAVIFAFLVTIITKLTFYASIGPLMADYWAFMAGIFLVSEGVWRISRSVENLISIQICRMFRISAGISLLVIHTLQFVRDGRLGI